MLATSAVHHHLIREGLRTTVGLVIETGEAREVHQFCTLAGFGAEAINPYLAFDTIEELRHSLNEDISTKEASKRLETLLISAIANWQSKNENSNVDAAQLFVKEIIIRLLINILLERIVK